MGLPLTMADFQSRGSLQSNFKSHLTLNYHLLLVSDPSLQAVTPGKDEQFSFMHSLEHVILVGWLCCSKRATLLYIATAPHLCKSCHREKIVKQERKNVELSAEGGIDTAYNSRGGELRWAVSVLS